MKQHRSSLGMRLGLFFLSVLCLLPAAIATCDRDKTYDILESYIKGFRSSIDGIVAKSCDDTSKRWALKLLMSSMGFMVEKLKTPCGQTTDASQLDTDCAKVNLAYELLFAIPYQGTNFMIDYMCRQQCHYDFLPLRLIATEDLNYIYSQLQ
ncbi:hypothetical protein L596_008913 [Steinernema carpocapsae]|uniref:Uncharacterized protein n=1 Tax=Steinernema carpocapsae TaxID=34508 RepID=A0A4U5PDX0_STECR|nr:hypothetical protein L596_008913 [Steinernema carpocapsae]